MIERNVGRLCDLENDLRAAEVDSGLHEGLLKATEKLLEFRYNVPHSEAVVGHK